MRVLKLLLFFEWVLGVFWIWVVATTPNAAMGVLFMLVLTGPFFLAFVITGGISWFRRPESRPIATAVVVTPFLVLFVPWLLRGAFGGPIAIPESVPFLLVAVLPLVTCLLVPGHVSELIPTSILKSRWLNLGLVVLLAGLVLLSLLVALALVVSTGEVRAGGRGGGLLLFAVVGVVVSGLLALPVLCYGWVGMFQDRDRSQQRLRRAQVILSLVLLAIAAPVIYLGLLGMVVLG